ncbi:MAG: FG-GAP-like repeat-containing protein [Planctomycetota bacterium]
MVEKKTNGAVCLSLEALEARVLLSASSASAMSQPSWDVIDFNGDGAEDLWRMDKSGEWRITTAQEDTQVWGAWSTAVTWSDVQATDFTGDGIADIVGRTNAGEWWLARSTGSGFVNELWGAWSAAVTWSDVQAADFTGDGKADIAGRTNAGQWWLGISSGSALTNELWGVWSTAVTWSDVQAADFTGDGKADIAGRTNAGQWWLGVSSRSAFTNELWGVWSTAVTWSDVQAADFTGDGKADIAGRTGSGTWWVGVSTGSHLTNELWGQWSASVTWLDAQAADLNGDGKYDLAGRTNGGEWWAGVSSGSGFTNEYLGAWSSAITWDRARIVDLEGDGADDILGRIRGTDAWWAGIIAEGAPGGLAMENTYWSPCDGIPFFRFDVFGDSQGNNTGVNDAVLSALVSLMVSDDPQLVVAVGDLVSGWTSDSILRTQLTHWREMMAPVYAATDYGAGVFAVPGNHEILMSSSETVWQGLFNDLPNNGPAAERYMTYSFDFGNCHFVMLDTDRAGNQHTINYQWLAADLAATTAEHIFVFGHEPAYPEGPHTLWSLDLYPSQRDAFWDLLASYSADVYFCGHEHLYDHQVIDGVNQVTTGGAGGTLATGWAGAFNHYTRVTVQGDYVSVSIVDKTGALRDRWEC